MNKLITGVIFICILLLLSSYFLGKATIKAFEREKDIYRAAVGQRFVLENDTLTIVDYSLMGETFTLSSGQKIDASMVFNKTK